MEKVCGLVPVNPHSSEIIAQKIVKRVSGKERQTVWDPISLISGIVKICLGSPSEVANRFRALLICSRPDSESDAVKRVRRILLKDERMVYAVRLAASSADLYVVRKASLSYN